MSLYPKPRVRSVQISRFCSSVIKEQTTAVTEYTVPLAQRLIEKVTVYDEKMIVRIRYGLEIKLQNK